MFLKKKKKKEIGNKPINLWSFVMTHFMDENKYKTCQCKKLNQ